MLLVPAPDSSAIPLRVLAPEALAGWTARQDASVRAWVAAMGFEAGLGEVLCLPAPDGGVAAEVAGWGTPQARARGRFHLAAAAGKLPSGRYALAEIPDDLDPELEALGWLLAGYRFERYRTAKPAGAGLVCPDGVDAARVERIAGAAGLVLDLINTPARDLGPEALEAAFVSLARRHGAEVRVTRGAAALRAANLPMIEAVGAAAVDPPRLLDLSWGRPDAPKVTLVGKGVCFDTGGLDIKPPASMGLMKKDMGGAATAMGLAEMIMGLGLDLRLRLLVPAVENAISAPAMRPGDILPSRKGLAVEVNNTDAEGRLVLADALALADEETPELIVSLATLTGAARVALGPDVPPFFTDDDGLAADLAAAAARVADPVWRLPLWDPYEPLIEPGIADLDNAPSGGMAGAITAALFLRRFVTASPRYLHLDIYGWTPVAKPGRPKGGACQAARALLALLEVRFCQTT
jgi:leucyl aminopeptidase